MTHDLFERHAVIRLLVYAVTIIAVLYAMSMLWGVVIHYGNILLLLFLAWIIAFALQPLLGILQQWGVPRLPAVMIIYLALLALSVGGIVLTIVTVGGHLHRAVAAHERQVRRPQGEPVEQWRGDGAEGEAQPSEGGQLVELPS